MDELLTADEVARLLRVRKARAYELVRLKIFPSDVSIRIGRQVRFSKIALQKFLAGGGSPNADATNSGGTDTSA
jgi:excisionase family DNA binding protein